MAIQIGIGFSQNTDTLTAAKEAAQQAKKQLKEHRIDLVILFNTTHYNPEQFLPTVHEILDQTKIIGSSTPGILLSESIEMRGIAIAAIASESTKFETGHITHLNLQDMYTAGKTLANNSLTDFGKHHRKLFFFFIDSLLDNIPDFISGSTEQLGAPLPVVGICSGDDFQFQKTYQYYQDKTLTKSVSGMLVGGLLNIGIDCQHGWRPLGKPRIIDQVDGNVIKSIDGKKAISIYEEYFGDDAATLKNGCLGEINIRYPLGIRIDGTTDYLLRNVRSILDDGSLVCQDNLKPGSEVHILIGNKESCLLSAENVAAEVKQQMDGKNPSLILIFESISRYRLLGRSALKELQVIKNTFEGTPAILGMYSCGEIFTFKHPHVTSKTYLQNGGIIILGIS